MKLSRLTLDEVFCRARQEAAKRLDCVVSSVARSRRGGHPMSEAPGQATMGRAYVAEVMPRRFFPGVANPDTAATVRTQTPLAARSVLHAAERCMSGRFDLLGYSGLHFGTPIDWHLDAVSGRRAPQIHFSRIDPLDPAMVGDSKVTWELNRHQWIVTLAQAARLTGDQRFAERAMTAIDAWIDANPVGIGINWSSSLEVALRLISWCWTVMLLRDSPALTRGRYLRIEHSARHHARHVERYLSHYFSPNTHLTGEALGLFYAGVVFASTAEAARWRDTGRRILIEQLPRQVASDGVYFEQATCYHRYTIEIYLHFLMLAAQNRIAVPADVGARISRMFDWLLSLGHADGTMPSIGDADGGWLLPLAPRQPSDCRGIFALGAVLFDRADLAWATGPGEPPSEVGWFLGSAALARLRSMERRAPSTPPSSLFPAGGYAVMRSGWQSDAHRLVLDTGALGCNVSGAHGHADLLSVLCSAFGEPYLIDPGTFCYTGDPSWRNYFRSTAAHNTLVVDGQNQAEPAGPFAWRTMPAARLNAWHSNDDCDFVDAFHDAYARGAQPVRHRRRVLFVKPWGWVVVDDLVGSGRHTIDLRFHFSPRPVKFVRQWARAESQAGHALWLMTTASQPLSAEIRDGRRDPIDGWQSPGYGMRQPIPTLVYAGTVTLPCRLTTVIVPMRPALAEPPAIEIRRDELGEPIAIGWPGENRLVQISAESLTLVNGEGQLRIA